MCLYTVYTSSTDPECPDESLSGVCRVLVNHQVVPPNRLFLQFNVFHCARAGRQRDGRTGGRREREAEAETDREREKEGDRE